MKIPRPGIYIIAILVLVAAPARADPFSGNYVGEIDGETYQLSLRRDSNGLYQGEISGEGASAYLQARLTGDRLEGVIDSAEQSIKFNAIIQQDGLLYFQDEEGELMVFERIGGASQSLPSNPRNQLVTASVPQASEAAAGNTGVRSASRYPGM